MAHFQLAGLEPVLLEKIITKLDEKSYFRIRQTCRGMDEFIRKNKNVFMHMAKSYDFYRLAFDKDEPHQLRILSGYRNIEKDIEGFYGTRFSRLYLPDDRFSQICEFLRKHRLTCEKLSMLNSKFTKEECATLLNILKPLSIELSSEQSNRYEALFQSKTLKKIEVKFNRKDVGSAIPRLLPAFPEVDIEVLGETDRYDMLRIILQFLCPQPPPNLKSFHFFVTGDRFVNFKTMEKKFRDFDLMVVGEDGQVPRIWVDFPDEFLCRVEICGRGMDVYYDQDGYSDYSYYDSDGYYYNSSYGYISD